MVKLLEHTLYGQARSLVSCSAVLLDNLHRSVYSGGEVQRDPGCQFLVQEEYLAVETLDQRLKDTTQGICALSLKQGPRTRLMAARLSHVASECGGSCQRDRAPECLSRNKPATVEHSSMHPHHEAICSRHSSSQIGTTGAGLVCHALSRSDHIQMLETLLLHQHL